MRLNYRIKQAVLLPKQTIEDYLQGIMILSEENAVHVYPERAKSVMLDMAPSLFFHVAEADTCEVNGFTFGSSTEVCILFFLSIEYCLLNSDSLRFLFPNSIHR